MEDSPRVHDNSQAEQKRLLIVRPHTPHLLFSGVHPSR